MLRISRLICGVALVLLLAQAVPTVLAQSQDLIVDICTTPNKYWNKAVALKGHVVKVTPDPPGTNRGRYTLRDQSDKDIEVATNDLPAQNKIYIIHGVVEQRKAGDNVPIVREDNRYLAQMDSPMTPPAAPLAAQRAPSAPRTAAPATKSLSKAEIEEAVRNELQRAKEAAQPAPPPVAAAPAPVAPVAPPASPSMMENPAMVAIIIIVILAIAAIVIIAMRKKTAPAAYPQAPPAYPPASTQASISPATMASAATTQVSSGSATMAASKGTEVFTRLGGELAVVEGPDRGRNFVIGKPTTLIGRAGQRKNDLELSDSTTSREQAKVLYNHVDRSFKIINESTTNPTRINGSAVDAVVLQDGDKIEFGNTVVKFKKS